MYYPAILTGALRLSRIFFPETKIPISAAGFLSRSTGKMADSPPPAAGLHRPGYSLNALDRVRRAMLYSLLTDFFQLQAVEEIVPPLCQLGDRICLRLLLGDLLRRICYHDFQQRGGGNIRLGRHWAKICAQALGELRVRNNDSVHDVVIERFGLNGKLLGRD